MKLYARITSDKDRKEQGKGGNKWLKIELIVGNDIIGYWIVEESPLVADTYTISFCETSATLNQLRSKVN